MSVNVFFNFYLILPGNRTSIPGHNVGYAVLCYPNHSKIDYSSLSRQVDSEIGFSGVKSMQDVCHLSRMEKDVCWLVAESQHWRTIA